MLSSDDHPITLRNRFAVWHTLDDTKSFFAEEVIVHLLLPVEGYVGWLWQALGVAAGSTCISMGGPSIHGSAR